ncbi:MAG: type II toxin-antitoxin system PemK/MazF family toxin [Mesorhizobium sp.]
MPTSEVRIPRQWDVMVGDVVVLPFPYADRLAEKRRPAVVVSLPSLAQKHGIVWVVMVTSAENAGWPGDVGISDLDEAGLTSPSVVRPAKIATVDLTRVLRVIGRLPAADTAALTAELRSITGL